MRGFDSFHPVCLFFYYICLLAITMFSMNPVILALGLVGSFYLYAMRAREGILSEIIFYVLLFVLLAAINPLFVHNGETILFFMNDNAITLEAILYGLASSLMLIGIFTWCRCYLKILTADKFLYLFGRITPKIGLILSMVFRFIPLFQIQIGRIGRAQKTMGLYASDSVPDRARGGIRVFDSLIAWSLESSVDTADAMRARGYGLPGRTSFTLFRFRKDDGILLAIMALLVLIIAIITARGGYTYFYYPYVKKLTLSGAELLKYLPVLLFFLIPGTLEVKERILWRL